MNVKIINDSFNRHIWNKIAIHPLQSWQWGEARKKMGIEVLRIVEFSNAYQITFHKIPFTNFKIGYLPRSNFPTRQALEFLYDYGKKNNVIFIKIEPYTAAVIPSPFDKLRVNSERDLATEGSVKKASYAPLESSVASLLRNDKRLVKSPHPLFPSWTQIIDLTKSEEELLKSMHHKTRYNIRLAQKKGVVVKEIANDEAFEIFSKLYFETCKRQKYFGHSLSYHKTVWENLKKEIAYILIAFYKDTPLAAYELFFFHDTMYYPYGGTSLEFRNLMASNLLLWEAIRLGRKISAKKFDVWGSLSADYENGHPWAGFTRFKQGYGGKFTQLIGSFDLVINPVEYKIYNALSKLRNSFLYLKNLI